MLKHHIKKTKKNTNKNNTNQSNTNKNNTNTKTKTKSKTSKQKYNTERKILRKDRPTEKATNYKLNKFKTKKNNLFRVSLRKDKKIWRRATSKEVKCYKYLQNKISYNLDEYKKGKHKSSKQAIAISYSQAKNKYPECNL